MKLLLSKGATQASGKQLDLTWDEFIELMQSQNKAQGDESDKTKSEAVWFSAAEYKKHHRRRENIIGRPWAIVADLDRVDHPEKVKKALSKYEYLAWTTWSSTPEVPRWRVVLPVRDGVDVEQFAGVVDTVLRPLNGYAKIDPKSRTPEQLWFAPIHKKSQKAQHRLWHNHGDWVKPSHESVEKTIASNIITVDFTGVVNVNRPEGIGKGDRNNALVKRLGMHDALLCTDKRELSDIAFEWNQRLKDPMDRREVLSVVRKTWNWMQVGTGVQKRAEAHRVARAEIEIDSIGVGVLDRSIATAKMPDSLVGDFLFPGATILSAKMKEGKSYLSMQLSMAVASGGAFLAGEKHPGFPVSRSVKAIILALEDTPAGINHRFHGNIAAGHLPRIVGDRVSLVFDEDLRREREKVSKRVNGTTLFEAMVQQWYNRGFRVICVDPLAVLEASLGMTYPGGETRNVHTADFLKVRYFTQLAQQYDDLHFILSMHHGKNKTGQNKEDPMDAIAGTTGLGAGAVTTIALMPIENSLEATDEDGEGRVSKRRTLDFLGRYTRQDRVLIEQHKVTGLWSVIGRTADEKVTSVRQEYFKGLMELGADENWVTGDALKKYIGRTHVKTIHQVLKRCVRDGTICFDRKIIVKRGLHGGYQLKKVVAKEDGSWLLKSKKIE